MVMKRVNGVTYKYKINGIPSQKLYTQRGLRQEDLLSSYLFILAMESLSYMLIRAELEGKISRVKVTPRPQPLTYLFFTDDIIVFSKVKAEETYEIIKILNMFSNASGQRINVQKYGLIFGRKVPKESRGLINGILNIQS